jgi:hypothetical protein
VATTTLDTMLPGFARYIGAFVGSFTTTTNIAGNTSLISTSLTDTGFNNDDALNDTFARITSGNNDETVRLVTDYTASTGALTLSGTNLTADSGSATFEIYRYDPSQLKDMLNDAREDVFPRLYKEVNDLSLTLAGHQYRYARPTSIRKGFVRQIFEEPRIDAKSFANNIVQTLNCDFETWTDSTTPADWVNSNFTSISQESETTAPDNYMVFAGTNSADRKSYCRSKRDT